MGYSVVIKNCTIYDGTGKPALENHTVLVKDGIVAALFEGGAGKEKALRENPGADVIDASGKFLLPGLMDAHIHLHGYSLTDSTVVKLWHLTTANPLKMLHGVNSLFMLLDSGYTTLRVMGMPHSMDVHLRDAVELGLIQGPRVLCSGQELSMTAGHGDMMTPPWALREPGLTADGKDECLKAVRNRVKDGVDFVKIHSGGGIMSFNDKLEWRNYTVEEIKVITEEAHAFELRVASHAEGTLSIMTSLLGGVDTIEHGFYLDDDCIELMIKNGTYLVPTLSPPYATATKGSAIGVPAELVEKGKRAHEAHMINTMKAYKAGVKIASGSDAFNLVRTREARHEFKLMTAIGIPTLDVIKAATLGAADALGIKDISGSIEEGKRADLILVTEDPLKDVSVLGDPTRTPVVIKAGVIVKDKR